MWPPIRVSMRHVTWPINITYAACCKVFYDLWDQGRVIQCTLIETYVNVLSIFQIHSVLRTYHMSQVSFGCYQKCTHFLYKWEKNAKGTSFKALAISLEILFWIYFSRSFFSFSATKKFGFSFERILANQELT